MSRKIVAFVAARAGSSRVPMKNLRLIDGKPMFYYLTAEALKSEKIDSVYLNTDSADIINAGTDLFGDSVEIYRRAKDLATSVATLDQYVYDFMGKVEGDLVLFLNPCSIFLSAETLDAAITYFLNNQLDSLVACEKVQTHVFCENKGHNFSLDMLQPRSQDLPALDLMTSGFFIWRKESFMKEYERVGYANFAGKFETFSVPKLEAIDIDSEEDFLFAKMVMECRQAASGGFLAKEEAASDDYYSGIWEKMKQGLIVEN